MRKDSEELIEKQLVKANRLAKANQYKKAAKLYFSAANNLVAIGKHELAIKSFLRAAKSFENYEKIDISLKSIRYAGNSAIMLENFKEAKELYGNAIALTSKLKHIREKNHYYTLFSVLSYICFYTRGELEKGLNVVKKIKKEVDPDYFKNSNLISFVTNITLTHRDRKLTHLEKIKENIEQYDLLESELALLKTVLLLTIINILIKCEFAFDKTEYTTNDLIKYTINFDTSELLENFTELSSSKFNSIQVDSTLIEHSDNLNISAKPQFPISIQIGEKEDLTFGLKPNFVLEQSFVGPVLFNCSLGEKYFVSFEKGGSLDPHLKSPPTSLDCSMKMLKPPLIGKDFPLEFTLENNSDSEALDINIEIFLPEKLRIIRGTTTKKIYSIRRNEKVFWELLLKPLEADDYNIKIKFDFKDPDSNVLTVSKEFELPINL